MADGSNYSSSQIISMQNDAIKRVNEMQRISREKLNQSHQQQFNSMPIDNRSRTHDEHETVQPEIVKTSTFQGILDNLNLDTETIIIMILLLLLVNEGADMSLILALVYILL